MAECGCRIIQTILFFTPIRNPCTKSRRGCFSHRRNTGHISPTRAELCSAEITALVRFDGRNFRAIISRDVEPLTLVSGIVELPDKHVYINTGVGIVRVATAELNLAFDQPAHRLNYELLDAHDGLRGVAQQNCNCNTATLGPDSRLWFITGNGIAWLDAAHLHRNKLAPPVYLRAISNGSTIYAGRPDLQLPPGSANLRFDYTALSYTDPDRMHSATSWMASTRIGSMRDAKAGVLYAVGAGYLSFSRHRLQQ